MQAALNPVPFDALLTDRVPLSCSRWNQKFAIDLSLPTSDYKGRNAITNHIDERSKHAHEAINSQDQRHSSHWNGRHHRERADEGDKRSSLHPTCAFGGENRDGEEGQLLHECEMGSGGLRNK